MWLIKYSSYNYYLLLPGNVYTTTLLTVPLNDFNCVKVNGNINNKASQIIMQSFTPFKARSQE